MRAALKHLSVFVTIAFFLAGNLGVLAQDGSGVQLLPQVSTETEVATESAVEAVESTTESVTEAAESTASTALSLIETAPPPRSSGAVDELTHNFNLVWLLICAFLVMLMQAGFAMVEAGFTRAKNCAHTVCMNLMDYCVAMMGFWLCGFAIMFGGLCDPNMSVGGAPPIAPPGQIEKALDTMIGFEMGGGQWGIMGGTGFMLMGDEFLVGGLLGFFVFQMMFMDTAATIPTGTLAERWKFVPFLMKAFFVGAFIYPLFGCWVWGGGWLAGLGINNNLGNGYIDFAGSSVVHLTGAMIALAGAIVVGPRYGKYNKDGTSNPIPGHNIPMAFLGTFLLAFGWFGFNAGSTLAGNDAQIGIISANTMLASAAGAIAAMATTWIRFGKPDPSFMANGLLAGLVSITAGCAFVDPWAAVLIGALGGLVVVYSATFVEESLKIDDPIGAISVHGTCGIWGVLSVGIFANGKYGDGWNGVDGAVAGLLYGNSSQIVAQFIGCLTCVVVVGLLSWLVFILAEKLVGNRPSTVDEIMGLDIPEFNVLGYQADIDPSAK